jgi:hypothetical protein
MEDSILYETLDRLAERFIPEGRHKYLYVNSRELWIELMVSLIESETIDKKISITNTICLATMMQQELKIYL